MKAIRLMRMFNFGIDHCLVVPSRALRKTDMKEKEVE